MHIYGSGFREEKKCRQLTNDCLSKSKKI